MSDAAPAIRMADRDGAGPAKRIRRPALSCVECRMRKVKCDRNKPCGACTRIKSLTCTYRSKRDGRHGTSPAASGLSASQSHGREEDNSFRSRSSTSGAGPSEIDLLLNRYVVPGITGEHGRAVMQPLPSHRAALDLSASSRTGDSAVIESFLERIHKLENQGTGNQSSLGSPSLPVRDSSSGTPGQFIKAKYYGNSHWMNALDPYDALGSDNTTVNTNTNRKEVNKNTDLYSTVSKIKKMARIIKASRLRQPTLTDEIQESIPSKEVCDKLIDCYFRTFESAFRVLHAPTFRGEYEAYWRGETPGKLSVIIKIMLVCAIGSPFYSGTNEAVLRTTSVKWVQFAVSWLHGPHTKSKLNMAGLQISILILLARQICSVDGDHVWILGGSLLRMAMQLGLHRDPAHFSKISPFHREMRRRLWATTLEITVQTSLDMGMPPMISLNDYDTKAPSNINDEDIGEGNDTLYDEKPSDVFTDSSIQIGFTETLPLRLEIIRLINHLRFDLSYEKVLQTGKDLIKTCEEQTVFLKRALESGNNVTPFHIKLADSLIRRFILCLHRPYFAKATENPQYHYSRKVCLDTSLAILAPATVLAPGEEDDWLRMMYRCVGFFKSFALYAMSTVYLELITQIEEQKNAPAIFAALVSDDNSSSRRPMTLPSQFHTLRDVLVWTHDMTIQRLRRGENNAKGAVFLACALARIDAMVSGADPEATVLETAKKSVEEAAQIMADTYQAEHGVPINLHNPNVTRWTDRGEGADDVTGKNLPTGTAVADSLGPEISIDGLPDPYIELAGNMSNGPESLNMFDGSLSNFSGDMDIDFSSFLGAPAMGAENPSSYFGRSPEWFYDLNGWAVPGNAAAADAVNIGFDVNYERILGSEMF